MKTFPTTLFCVVLGAVLSLALTQECCTKKDCDGIKKSLKQLKRTLVDDVSYIKNSMMNSKKSMMKESDGCCCCHSANQSTIEYEIKHRLKVQGGQVKEGKAMEASLLWDSDGLLVIDDMMIMDNREEILKGQLEGFVRDGVYPYPTLQKIEGNCHYQIAYGICNIKNSVTDDVEMTLRMIMYFKYDCMAKQWNLRWELNNVQPPEES